MFLSGGKLVLCSFIIFFKFAQFIFCFCVSVCFLLLGCVVLLFSEVGDSFWLDCSCLSVLGVSDIVLLSCFLFLFSGVFLVFQCQKTNFSLLLSKLGHRIFGLLSENKRILARSLSLFSYILLV